MKRMTVERSRTEAGPPLYLLLRRQRRTPATSTSRPLPEVTHHPALVYLLFALKLFLSTCANGLILRLRLSLLTRPLSITTWTVGLRAACRTFFRWRRNSIVP